MEIITGGVTAAKGFLAAGVEAGIKYQNRKDMAMVYSKTPCRAAGVFTTNVVKAAPVLWDKEVVESEWEAQAIVVSQLFCCCQLLCCYLFSVCLLEL